jgi:hypothetical protein
MLDIKNCKAVLPNDFQYLQLALLCSVDNTYEAISPSTDAPKLNQTVTDFTLENKCNSCPTSCPTGTNAALCGTCYKLYEFQPQDLTISYDKYTPVKLTKKSYNYCDTSCLNMMCTSDKYKYTLDIDENVMTLSNIKSGKLYLNYITDMVNDNDDIIIVDHPLLNDYYEYAVKEKMLENYMLNNDADVINKLQYVRQKKELARIQAMNFVYMPEFTEITEYQTKKRNNFYNKYLKAFERY